MSEQKNELYDFRTTYTQDPLGGLEAHGQCMTKEYSAAENEPILAISAK